MTQEEKQLLLKDLCARLPYGVKVKCPHWDYERDDDFITIETLIGIDDKFCYTKNEKGNIDSHCYTAPLSPLKPYLRPMSSITEEEKWKLKGTTCPNGTGYFDEKYLLCPMNHYGEQISYEFMQSIIDWLNSHHFDYRWLIEKGLALEAPEGMYNETVGVKKSPLKTFPRINEFDCGSSYRH